MDSKYPVPKRSDSKSVSVTDPSSVVLCVVANMTTVCVTAQGLAREPSSIFAVACVSGSLERDVQRNIYIMQLTQDVMTGRVTETGLTSLLHYLNDGQIPDIATSGHTSRRHLMDAIEFCQCSVLASRLYLNRDGSIALKWYYQLNGPQWNQKDPIVMDPMEWMPRTLWKWICRISFPNNSPEHYSIFQSFCTTYSSVLRQAELIDAAFAKTGVIDTLVQTNVMVPVWPTDAASQHLWDDVGSSGVCGIPYLGHDHLPSPVTHLTDKGQARVSSVEQCTAQFHILTLGLLDGFDLVQHKLCVHGDLPCLSVLPCPRFPTIRWTVKRLNRLKRVLKALRLRTTVEPPPLDILTRYDKRVKENLWLDSFKRMNESDRQKILTVLQPDDLPWMEKYLVSDPSVQQLSSEQCRRLARGVDVWRTLVLQEYEARPLSVPYTPPVPYTPVLTSTDVFVRDAGNDGKSTFPPVYLDDLRQPIKRELEELPIRLRRLAVTVLRDGLDEKTYRLMSDEQDMRTTRIEQIWDLVTRARGTDNKAPSSSSTVAPVETSVVDASSDEEDPVSTQPLSHIVYARTTGGKPSLPTNRDQRNGRRQQRSRSASKTPPPPTKRDKLTKRSRTSSIRNPSRSTSRSPVRSSSRSRVRSSSRSRVRSTSHSRVRSSSRSGTVRPPKRRTKQRLRDKSQSPSPSPSRTRNVKSVDRKSAADKETKHQPPPYTAFKSPLDPLPGPATSGHAVHAQREDKATARMHARVVSMIQYMHAVEYNDKTRLWTRMAETKQGQTPLWTNDPSLDSQATRLLNRERSNLYSRYAGIGTILRMDLLGRPSRHVIDTVPHAVELTALRVDLTIRALHAHVKATLAPTDRITIIRNTIEVWFLLPAPYPSIHIHLRVYHSAEEVLHGLVIGAEAIVVKSVAPLPYSVVSSTVATTILVSDMFRYSVTRRMNLLPAVSLSDTSLNERQVHQSLFMWWKRGWKIGLPYLDPPVHLRSWLCSRGVTHCIYRFVLSLFCSDSALECPGDAWTFRTCKSIADATLVRLDNLEAVLYENHMTVFRASSSEAEIPRLPKRVAVQITPSQHPSSHLWVCFTGSVTPSIVNLEQGDKSIRPLHQIVEDKHDPNTPLTFTRVHAPNQSLDPSDTAVGVSSDSVLITYLPLTLAETNWSIRKQSTVPPAVVTSKLAPPPSDIRKHKRRDNDDDDDDDGGNESDDSRRSRGLADNEEVFLGERPRPGRHHRRAINGHRDGGHRVGDTYSMVNHDTGTVTTVQTPANHFGPPPVAEPVYPSVTTSAAAATQYH